MSLNFLYQPAQFIFWMTVLSACVGSFITMLVYRVPKMLRKDRVNGKRINLFFPASFCPACAVPLKCWHNIPVLGYVLLRGLCGNCQAAIGKRYVIIECLCVIGGGVLAYLLGPSIYYVVSILALWIVVAVAACQKVCR